MYSLKIHKKAIKFLQSREATERRRIKQKLELLKENPHSNTQLDIKKLKGEEELFRLRIGKIRIIYKIIEGELIILIITAGVRGDV
ncbi:type II toxin-antitoxin system RelE family toxin [Maribellus sediminis]|uniref:type II toxin-antitoxin system RelE family toxin n=1 Tax=Maribellus sediminis TaxID=2696285 RepID=UPI0014304136|nr:type II toxin-antitoxin system RelE/ParE family toxin [Maribellus sediminis]